MKRRAQWGVQLHGERVGCSNSQLCVVRRNRTPKLPRPAQQGFLRTWSAPPPARSVWDLIHSTIYNSCTHDVLQMEAAAATVRFS